MIDFTQTNSAATDITMPDLEEFMTTKEAAKKLGFHVKSVQNMVKKKTLQGVRFGHAWLISKESVSEYLKNTKGKSKNDPRRKTNNN